VIVRSLVTLGHLGRWLERSALAVDQLTAGAVSGFLAEYRGDRGRLPGASVWPLLEYLRAEGGVAPEPPAVVAPVEQLVSEYREWLVCARGLAPVTVRSSQQVARRFLAQRVSAGDPGGVLGITATEVNDFLVRECARVSSGSAGCCTSRLRSLLRYLAVRGFADPGLPGAVPRVARWREATIPQFPTRPQIERLLASCDRKNETGARDYAVLLLLARLGLRAVEVARLRLDDLDWRAGQIIVDGKAHRRDQLPLPGDVGEAIVEHLKAALEALIEAHAIELKLPTVRRRFRQLAAEATREQQTPVAYLAALLEAEMAERAERRERRRLIEARFPQIKRLEDFRFADNPNVPQATIAALAEGSWIDDRETVIFVGDSGTGKTMLATALAVCACHQGRRVRFTTLAGLANELQEAQGSRELARVVGRYARTELVVLDELGYLALPDGAAELVFQVLSERHERGSLIVTTNLPFGEWTKVFPDPPLAKAVVDRLTHRAHIIDTGTESWRFRHGLKRKGKGPAE
jgi:DNA replication protein DnaC